MTPFVYLRNATSRSLESEHLSPGYHIHEAFTVSEAVWLCTQQHLGMIVIADNLDYPEVSELERRFAMFCLKPHTTINELLCHLAGRAA
jgi:hypothetical protein